VVEQSIPRTLIETLKPNEDPVLTNNFSKTLMLLCRIHKLCFSAELLYCFDLAIPTLPSVTTIYKIQEGFLQSAEIRNEAEIVLCK
jgi:hypothetical protein